MPDFLPVVLVIAVVVALIYLSHLQSKARRREMAALASQLGWRFDPESGGDHDGAYGHLSVFKRGRHRQAFNSLLGNVTIDGRIHAAKAGDFRFTTGSGKNRRVHRFSYVLLNVPFRSTPDLHIRRENVFDKVAGAIGFDDIDFESEEFSGVLARRQSAGVGVERRRLLLLGRNGYQVEAVRVQKTNLVGAGVLQALAGLSHFPIGKLK
jgi:hypothetical protein